MAGDRVGQDTDYQLGAVKRTLVDQGDSTFASKVSIGSPGGVKVWGQSSINGTATLRAASAKRKSLMVKNKSNSVGTAFLGGVGTTINDGFELLPGETIVINDSTDDVVIATSGGAATIFWLEERNA